MILRLHPGAFRCTTACWVALLLYASAPPAVLAAEPAARDALRAAEKRAVQIPDRFARTWAQYAVAEQWSHIDPARAAELADQLPSWTAKRDLLSVVMFAWGRIDPQAAGQWGVQFKERTQGTLDQRNTALRYAVVGMVTRDPKLAEQLMWKHLQEEGWGGTPRTTPMEAARELAKSYPVAALAMAEKITGHEAFRVDALRGVLREWARKDPAAARAALGSRKEADFQKAFPRDLAEGWASLDPRAAAAYARTIEDPQVRIMALALVAREMACSDPKAAAELCAIFAPLNVGKWHEQFPRLGLIVAEVGRRCAVNDLQAAIAWADSLPAAYGGCRVNAFDGVAAGWAEKDPKAALQYYTTGEKASTDRARTNRGTGAAYPAIARQLACSDVEAALKLVAVSESLVLKSHVIHEVALAFAGRDPAAAADLVQRWSGVVDYYGYRSGAAAAVGAAWAAKEPKLAAAWAVRLVPDRDRAAALRAVAAAWARRSLPEARQWADSLPAPDDAVHALVGVAEGVRR